MAQIITIEPDRSAHIARLGYDPDHKYLYVTFTNKSTYTHSGVPETVFAAMTRERSMGTYYHRVIKRHYPIIHKSAPGEQEEPNGNKRTANQDEA